MASFDPPTDIPRITRAGWQCPECKTVYSPDVKSCECATVKRSPSDRIGTASPIRFGSACTCTPYGPSTVPCPVHQPVSTSVIC